MQVIKPFILVVSLWGYNGNAWVYTGNQMVLKEPMPKEQCETIAANWQKFEMNQYFRFSIECIEDIRKQTWHSHYIRLKKQLNENGATFSEYGWTTVTR